MSLRLGKRTTKKFIEINRQDVIENPNTYYNMLHNQQIAKSVNQDFKDLYLNLFPKTLDELRTSYYKIFAVLQQLPRNMRDINLLLTAFEKKYDSQIWNNREFVNFELLKLLSPNERDSKIQPKNKPDHISKTDWNCYMKTEKSIPYLKREISRASGFRRRADLVPFLVETCKINEDKVALTSVCEYMLSEHRTDEVSVRKSFVTAIQEKLNLSDLEEQHWRLINDLFASINESLENYNCFFEAYIHFCLKHDLPIKEHLIKWLELYSYRLNIIKKEPKYEKQCLLMFGEVIPALFKEERVLDKRNVAFIAALISWNRRHPKDEIPLFLYSGAMSSIKRRLIKEKSAIIVRDVIKYCLPLKTDAEERENLLNLYLTRSYKYYLDISILKWLIQYEPLIIVRNIDATIQFLLNMPSYRADYFFWKYWTNYTHLESSQKVINACQSALEENKEDDNYQNISKNAIIGLSYLLSGGEFKKFIIPYLPSDMQVDVTSEETRTLYNIQQNIGSSLKNLNPPSLALESVLIFCNGDYLKLIRKSLYSVCSNVNDNKLPPLFSELSGRAASVRKHAMQLAFRVLDKEQMYKVLQGFMETEKEAYLRKFLFKCIFKFFIMNADDHSWEMVKGNASSLDVKEILMQVDKIPDEYLVQYIMFTWEFLNRLSKKERELESDQIILLDAIKGNTINEFPKEFCSTLIEKHFFKFENAYITGFLSRVVTFTCRYVIYCDSSIEQETRLKSNFEIVQNFVLTPWDKSEVRERARNGASHFLKEFCGEFLTYNCLDSEILIKFANLWNNLFKAHQAFEEYLHLQFTLIHVQRLPVAQIGIKLSNLCDSLTSVYGSAVLNLFRKKINYFGQFFLSGTGNDLELNWYILMENLIQAESSIYSFILVSLLLNDHKPTITKTEIKHETIMDLLNANPNPAIQLHLENVIRGNTLDYN